VVDRKAFQEKRAAPTSDDPPPPRTLSPLCFLRRSNRTNVGRLDDPESLWQSSSLVLVMLDVLPIAKQLCCLICGAPFAQSAGLAWHRIAKHKTIEWQPDGGHSDVHVPAGARRAGRGGGTRVGYALHHPLAPAPPPTPPPPPPPPPPPLPPLSPLLPPTELPRYDGGASAGADAVDGGQLGGPQGVGSPSPPPVGAASANAATDAAACPSGDEFEFEESAVGDAVATMDRVIEVTRTDRGPVYGGPARKKARRGKGGSQPTAVGYDYATLSADVRQLYEEMHDWDFKAPILTKRTGCRPGRFDSYRTRMVQRFALECGNEAGLSLVDQEGLFNILDVWDSTRPGQPVDRGHYLGLRDSFRSANAFKEALMDDIDDAVEDEKWLKCHLTEGGETIVDIFRLALEVALRRMKAAKRLKLWSGGDRPAPLTTARESPMDRDAFRSCEAAVIDENDDNSFVVALHAFSDAIQLSSYGGTFERGHSDAHQW